MKLPLAFEGIEVVVAAGRSPRIEDHGPVFHAGTGGFYCQINLKGARGGQGDIFQMGWFSALLGEEGLDGEEKRRPAQQDEAHPQAHGEKATGKRIEVFHSLNFQHSPSLFKRTRFQVKPFP